jgi:hypothetical protein
MRHKRVLQRLVAALSTLGSTKTEVLQARLGTKLPARGDKRRD